MERQKEQILADCRAEIHKHEFQAEHDKKKSKIECSYRVQAKRNWSHSYMWWTISTRSTASSWTTIRTRSGSSWSSWEKSQWDGRIEAISRVYIRYNFEEEVNRRSRHYPRTHSQDSGMIRETSKMLNHYAVDHPTLPVKLRFSHLFEILAECKAVLWEFQAASIGRQAFGTHMVLRETFLQIQPRVLQHLIRRNWIHGVLICRNQFTHQRRRRMRIKHQFRIRDASLDRQPKIQSSSVEETLQRIMEQTKNDCRFWIFISTCSLHQLRLLAGR